MAQFPVNPQRLTPYPNFKYRLKWDGKYVAGVSKVGSLKRTMPFWRRYSAGGVQSKDPSLANQSRPSSRAYCSASRTVVP